MTTATYVLEVNWNGDGTTFVDETAQILSVGWGRGRDYASQLAGRALACSLDAVLLNPSGRYASFNASGPLYGNLLPTRKVRWKTTAPVAQTLFAGFLDVISPGPRSRDGQPTATLRALGPLSFIAEKDATVSPKTSVATGTAVGYVLDDAGWPAGDRTIDTGQVTMTRWAAEGDKALTHIRDLENTEMGYLGESKDGKIVYEDSHHRLQTPHTVSQATFSDTAGAALSYDTVEQLDPWRDVFNRFSAVVRYPVIQTLAVIWTLAAAEIPTVAPSGGTVELWARYPTPDAPTQALEVDAWTTPVATTDYLANAASDGSGSNLTASVSVVATKFANSMKLVFTNAATIPAYLTFLQARGTAVYLSDPVSVLTEDAASQTKYGKRTYPLPGKFYPTTVRARAYTEYGVSRFKDPLPILALTFQADQSDNHMTQALSRDISDRITIVANNTLASGAQLGLSRDFFIEAEHHQYDLSAHRVRYELSDATGDAGYWALGISTLGQTTKLNV